METVTDFIFLGSKITVDSDCSHEIKIYFLHGRKAMMTERLHFHFSLSCIGEGSRDGGALGCRLWGRTESDTTEVT